MLDIHSGPGDLIFINWSASKNDQGEIAPESIFAEVVTRLNDLNAIPLQERIFGKLSAAKDILEIRDLAYVNGGDWGELPPTYVEGAPLNGGDLAGLHIIAVKNIEEAELIIENNVLFGATVATGDIEYLALRDVSQAIATEESDPVKETAQAFRLTGNILQSGGWSFKDVQRTWFYLKDILNWYDDFNRVRNDFFNEIGVKRDDKNLILPASTGIEGQNYRGSWCTLDVMAMRQRNGGNFEVKRLINPTQNEAPEYGSAFSRGLSVANTNEKYLFISGTASINVSGETTHVADFDAQTEQTMDSIDQLLRSGGGSFADVVQATAFVKREQDIPLLEKHLKQWGLDKIPVVCTLSAVCRDDLLYELDATAVISK